MRTRRPFPIVFALALLTLIACGPKPGQDTSSSPASSQCALESSDVPVLVHFYAQDVSPEATMSDILRGVHDDFGESLEVVEIDGEQCPDLARSHGVDFYPTVVLMRAGQPDVQVRGWVSREHLDLWLEANGVTMQPSG